MGRKLRREWGKNKRKRMKNDKIGDPAMCKTSEEQEKRQEEEN